jgi:mannose-6-phosphate isomerase-like protein (cupin superfamily)
MNDYPPKPIFSIPQIVEKGWGEEQIITNNEEYCGKILKFNKGAVFSCHFHSSKREHFYVAKGLIKLVTIDTSNAQETEFIMGPGQVVEIPRLLPHQIFALEESEIYEFSTTHSDMDSFRVKKGNSQGVKQQQFMENQNKECGEFIRECMTLGEKKIKQEELAQEIRHGQRKKQNLEIAEKLKLEFPTLNLYDELNGYVEICGHNFSIKKDLTFLIGNNIETKYYLSPKNDIWGMIFNKADFGEYLARFDATKKETRKKSFWSQLFE